LICMLSPLACGPTAAVSMCVEEKPCERHGNSLPRHCVTRTSFGTFLLPTSRMSPMACTGEAHLTWTVVQSMIGMIAGTRLPLNSGKSFSAAVHAGSSLSKGSATAAMITVRAPSRPHQVIRMFQLPRFGGRTCSQLLHSRLMLAELHWGGARWCIRRTRMDLLPSSSHTFLHWTFRGTSLPSGTSSGGTSLRATRHRSFSVSLVADVRVPTRTSF